MFLFLLGTTPIFTAAISNLMGFEVVGKKLWLGILLSFTGVVLIVFGRGFHIGSTAGLIGDILIVLASAVWSIYTCFLKRLSKNIPPGITSSIRSQLELWY